MTRRAVLWIDHVHAVVADLHPDSADVHRVDVHAETPQLHRKSGPQGSGHLAEDTQLFESVVDEVQHADELLVVGPGLAKQAFRRYLDRHHPAIAGRIVEVETVDHPTDAQLVALARAEFRRIDQLRGVR